MLSRHEQMKNEVTPESETLHRARSFQGDAPVQPIHFFYRDFETECQQLNRLPDKLSAICRDRERRAKLIFTERILDEIITLSLREQGVVDQKENLR